MDIERIAAFSDSASGGNPAGVVIEETLPAPKDMAETARAVGYSETAFAAPLPGGAWRVRYFSPASEVPFCGHATIALGAALAARHGAGRFDLHLNAAEITVEATEQGGHWHAALTSPPTSHAPVSPEDISLARRLFSLTDAESDPALPILRISAGADMLLLPVRTRARLAHLEYPFEETAAFLNARGFIGAYFIHRAESRLFDVRLAFPTGGVVEDPATGAAAAALSGWLRHSGALVGEITIRQGDDMGMPSRLTARAEGKPGRAVTVSGATRRLE